MGSWTTAEAQKLLRDGYTDGYADGWSDGIGGRGSRARYRRAVEAFLLRHQTIADVVYADAARGPVEYVDALGREHMVPVRDYLAWHERAELRARHILTRLDGAG